MPVAHRPLIGFALSWLESAGIRRIVVCGNRSSGALEARLARGSAPDLDVSYLADSMPRGAAGCVRDAALSCDGDTFVVTDAAAIPTIDLHDLLDTHHRAGAVATMAVYREPRGGGRSPLQVPAGVYVFDRRAIETVAARGFVDIKEHLIPQLARAGERIATYSAASAVPRVLNADTYLVVNDIVTHGTTSARIVLEGYEARGAALVHRDAIIEPDVTMVGPVLVAAGARIAGRAVLIGPTSIGCDVTVEAGALISRSAVWRRSRIGAKAVVDRAIVGDDGVVASGRHVYRAVVANGVAGASARPVAEPQTPRSAA